MLLRCDVITFAPDKRFTFLLGFAGLVLVALCFWPGLGGGFLFDDRPNIAQNTALHIDALSLDALYRAAYSFPDGSGMRALAEVTFALDHWRAGLNPTAFKSTNLVIHVLTCLALAGFLRLVLTMAGQPPQRAALAALVLTLVWAIHPLQVSSVLYVVQRMQTLGTLFTVLALWAWLRMRQTQICGQSGLLPALLAGLCWALALASKEDSVLLPVYTLMLELTVLQFRAAQPETTRMLRRVYWMVGILGAVAYLFVVVPHYWSTGPYGGRDFSSLERLLTQGRMLAMYLGQILWPLPGSMPFYYDGVVASRGLLSPVSTLPALLLMAGLIGVAWHLRHRQPLLSLGILLFFAGHVVTSNVVPLELAYEHRNHFPLIGAVLAVGSAVAMLFSRLRVSPHAVVVICLCALASLAAATLSRSSLWGDPQRFAETAPLLAPDSARAWLVLCGFHYERFLQGDQTVPNADLDRAIAACEAGKSIPYTAALHSNVILFKTRRGDVTPDDWDAYLERLKHVVLGVESKNSVWMLVGATTMDIPLDTDALLRALKIVARRAGFSYVQYAQLGYFALETAENPDEALTYFALAVKAAPPDSPMIEKMLSDLVVQGYEPWVETLKELGGGK